MAELPPELIEQAPVQQEQPQAPTAGSAMRAGVQDSTGDFITFMVELLESKGIDIDEAFNPTVEDQFDVVEGDSDPLQLLSEEEMIMLVEKFNALPPEVQAKLEEAFVKELPPRFIQRLRGVQRFVAGRTA